MTMKEIKLGCVSGRHEMPVDGYILERVGNPADVKGITEAVDSRMAEIFRP